MPETKFTFDPTNPAHLRAKATLEWAAKQGKPEPEKISPNEAQYRRLTGQAGTWVNLEDKAKEEADRRRAHQERYAGTPGEWFKW